MKYPVKFSGGLATLCAPVVACALLLGGCEKKAEAPPLPGQHVDLHGARNFRDLGGYATTDGRHVKPGLLYRSDSLSLLDDADLKRLEALHLRTVYDFRSAEEIKPAPDRLPEGGDIRQLALSIGDPNVNIEELRAHILSGHLEQLHLPDSYADVALQHSEAFRDFFANLLDPERAPGVFHCTGGKDRTGVAAALFLHALGVPHDTIMRDYLASNYYLHDFIESSLWKVRFASFFRVDSDRFRALMGVRPSYLENMFQAIDARYGSIDRYLEDALDLDAEKRERLRAMYLE